MIEMLKDWVRDLVIIVIFANLIEMLLPDSSMRKYLKVVMGFFILLTVLNPLLTILHADYQAFYPFVDLPGQKQQQNIQRQGEAMHQQNQATAMETYQRQLAQQIRGLILTQAEVQDAKVQVESDATGQIKEVAIHLETRTGQESSAPASSTTSRIDPIEQVGDVSRVKVEISPQSKGEQPQRGNPAEQGQQGAQSQEQVQQTLEDQRVRQIQNKVVNLLTSFYNLKPEAIRFQ